VTAAHRGLSTELRLFLVQARPHFSARGLAEDHLALVAGLEAEGTDALERHLQASAGALTGAPTSSPAAAPVAQGSPGRPATI
jgi:hypothetical protein